MKTNNPIKLGIEKASHDALFERKSSTWHRELDETVLVIEVQKSNYGEQYYLNLGVWVKGLSDADKHQVPPKETQCHIRVRVEALEPRESDDLKRILDLDEASLDALQRQAGVESAIRRIAIPFLLRCSTRSGIREAFAEGRLDSALVHKSLRDLVL